MAGCAFVTSASAGLRLDHAQGCVQGDLRLGELVPVDHEQHIGLTRGLGYRQDVDIILGQSPGGLGQDAGLRNVGADGAGSCRWCWRWWPC